MPALKRPRQARPGEPLGFSRALRKAKKWPPTKIPRHRSDVPPATPYIVVPPDAIDVLDAAGNAVDAPVAGTAYTLRAKVRNDGPAAAYAGVVEFSVADPATVSTASTFAIEGFVAQPGATVAVSCRRSWTPADATEAAGTILICAFDALLDRPPGRFGPPGDRHVGRRDLVPDFSGTWEGLQYFAPGPPGHGYLYRVVVQQTGADVALSIFEEVTNVSMMQPSPTPVHPGRTGPPGTLGTLGGSLTPVLPGTPQLTGPAKVAGGRVEVTLTGMNGQPPAPFTSDLITLTLPTPDTLHVTQRESFLDPADTRGPNDLVADLTRTP